MPSNNNYLIKNINDICEKIVFKPTPSENAIDSEINDHIYPHYSSSRKIIT